MSAPASHHDAYRAQLWTRLWDRLLSPEPDAPADQPAANNEDAPAVQGQGVECASSSGRHGSRRERTS